MRDLSQPQQQQKGDDCSERQQSSSSFYSFWKIIVTLAVFIPVPEFILRKKFPVHSHGAILITGTSSGIGRSTCGDLATKYPSITMFCGIRNLNDAKDYPFSLPNVEPIILDITKEDQIQESLSTISSSGLPLIALVNNAGVLKASTVEFFSMSDLRWMYEVNVFGTFRLTQAALPLLRESRGRVVVVSSIGGEIAGLPLHSGYQGTKHAIEAIFDSLRIEVDPHGVSVSLVEPGILESEITRAQAKVSDVGNITNESEIYPKVSSAEAMELWAKFYSIVGDIQETCDAIEHALMSKYPRTRYRTARLGPFPSTMVHFCANIIPDRLFDWLAGHLEIFILAQTVREFVEDNFVTIIPWLRLDLSVYVSVKERWVQRNIGSYQFTDEHASLNFGT